MAKPRRCRLVYAGAEIASVEAITPESPIPIENGLYGVRIELAKAGLSFGLDYSQAKKLRDELNVVLVELDESIEKGVKP